MGPVTPEALADYLGVDAVGDAMTARNLSMAADSANARLAGALGAGADLADPRALNLGLMWAADSYDERGTGGSSAKEEGACARAERDMVLQLQLEARARREAGA